MQNSLISKVILCVLLPTYCKASAWIYPPLSLVLLPNISIKETMHSHDYVFLPG